MQMPQQEQVTNISANAAIEWVNGRNENMHISPSGSTLTFASSKSDITIFSRIDSARNGSCEYYYSEQSVKTRIQVCENGEVTLIVGGKVANVGMLAKFEE
ncbi:hypothetical protein ABT56_03390 [Photobacterium aquae]|uniref:C-type lysozyme inhibitor domain-containing protein n=2 Tax=Photobacterium aquae TaxID=1195763 RepID=A0A0J1HCH4_9GAMM|nr:hypothetical protein ABT56_03390 [Photobacterium aquae]